MDDRVFLWELPAVFLLIAAQNFAQSRGRLNTAFMALFGVFIAYLVITFTVAGSRPSADLVLVTVAGALYLVAAGVRARVAGLDAFLAPERRIRGLWSAARIRGRTDRGLRRSGESPAPPTHASVAGTLLTAAREAGAGDLVAAVARLDSALDPPVLPVRWPDARLALMLYHRTVYSALATVAGDCAPQPTRWHNDLDLARTLLPDVRLGWLADSAVAVAEGRLWPAVHATDALLSDARGPWENGLGAVVARLARDVPDALREHRHARLVERNPWMAGLAARLRSAAAIA